MMDFMISKGSARVNRSKTKNLIINEINILNIIEIKSELISKVNGKEIFKKVVLKIRESIRSNYCILLKYII